MAVMFYPKDTNLSLYGGSEKKEKKLRHDETTMRILLKGAVHFLYSETTPVVINTVVTDGDPTHRQLSKDRVIMPLLYDELNLRTPLRDHVKFTDETEIIALNSDHKKYKLNSNEYIYANLLQVSDLILGSTIESCLKGVQDWSVCPEIGQRDIQAKQVVAYPIAEMLGKVKRGRGFQNSGHYKSFTISNIRFHEDGVVFREVRVRPLSKKSAQIEIPYK